MNIRLLKEIKFVEHQVEATSNSLDIIKDSHKCLSKILISKQPFCFSHGELPLNQGATDETKQMLSPVDPLMGTNRTNIPYIKLFYLKKMHIVIINKLGGEDRRP